jgi:hypothetical protein
MFFYLFYFRYCVPRCPFLFLVLFFVFLFFGDLFSMFHKDAPTMFPMFQGLGYTWGNIYPHPPFGETHGEIFP